MIQRGERLGLALEARESIGVACEGLWQDLDRDITIELGVARPVYLAHSAFADLRGDFVDAETGAGGESQTMGLYGRDGCGDAITPA